MKIKVKWNLETYNKFLKYLEGLKDEKTKAFNEKIINTKYKVLGIKIPILRVIAKDISKTDYKDFLDIPKSTYYEEILIEGLLLGYIEEPNEFLEYFYKYLPKIDCWALCDSPVSNFKIMKKEDFSDVCYGLILDSREFYVRVGYVILLNYYVDSDHIKDILSISLKDSDYYYVNMAIAWLLSICFIKFREDTLALLKEKKLSKDVQNKTISKICDSYRVTKKDKETVKKYTIK